MILSRFYVSAIAIFSIVNLGLVLYILRWIIIASNALELSLERFIRNTYKCVFDDEKCKLTVTDAIKLREAYETYKKLNFIEEPLLKMMVEELLEDGVNKDAQ